MGTLSGITQMGKMKSKGSLQVKDGGKRVRAREIGRCYTAGLEKEEGNMSQGLQGASKKGFSLSEKEVANEERGRAGRKYHARLESKLSV